MFCKLCNGTFFAKGLCKKHYNQLPEIKTKGKEYRSKHSEEIKAKKKEYYSKPEIKAKMKEYYSKHSEEIKAKRKEASRKQWLKKQRQNPNWRPRASFEERMNKMIAERAEYLKKRGIYCRAILPRKYLTKGEW